jgi:hypothetical protein
MAPRADGIDSIFGTALARFGLLPAAHDKIDLPEEEEDTHARCRRKDIAVEHGTATEADASPHAKAKHIL